MDLEEKQRTIDATLGPLKTQKEKMELDEAASLIKKKWVYEYNIIHNTLFNYHLYISREFLKIAYLEITCNWTFLWGRC